MFVPLLLVAGGVFFKVSSPRTCPPLSRTENIFVLTGDIRRIPAGIRLLENYPMRRMYIIGIGGHSVPGATAGNLSTIDSNGISQMIPPKERGKVHIETESRSTYENALAIRSIARAQNIKRFALVTTADHMNRSLLLVKRRMPDAEIIACPVPLHGMPANRRLERWGTEYMKFLGTLIGIESKKME